MTAPSDEDLRAAYSVFDRRHEALRDQLLNELSTTSSSALITSRLKSLLSADEDRRWMRLPLGIGLAAACLIALATAAFMMNHADRAYGVQGLRERLLNIRSVHIKGWKYQSTSTEFGEAWVRFPIEHFFERPDKRRHTGYGFSSNGDELTQVTQVEVVCDGETLMYLYHHDKQAARAPIDPLDAELAVEELLQGSIADQLVQGVPDRFSRIGSEQIGNVQCDLYETIHSLSETLQFRLKLWIDPSDGMPVRLESFMIKDGEAAPFFVFDEIVVNGPRPEGALSLEIPDGYEQIAASPEANAPRKIRSRGSATAGPISHAVATGFRIDDSAVLLCWWQRSDIDGERRWFDSPPKFQLEGVERRDCNEVALHTDALGEDRWRWSLIVPEDGGSIGSDSLLMTNRSEQGGQISSGVQPLVFPDRRLAEIIEELQQRSLGPDGDPGDIWTLERIRGKLRQLGVAD